MLHLSKTSVFILGMMAVVTAAKKICVTQRSISDHEYQGYLNKPCLENNTLSAKIVIEKEIMSVESAVWTLCRGLEICNPELVDFFLCEPKMPAVQPGEKEPLYCVGCHAKIDMKL